MVTVGSVVKVVVTGGTCLDGKVDVGGRSVVVVVVVKGEATSAL